MMKFTLVVLLLISLGCSTSPDNTVIIQEEINTTDQVNDFILYLIESGELNLNLRLDLNPDDLYVENITEALKPTESKNEIPEYTYQPDMFRSQAIDAYVDYGIVNENDTISLSNAGDTNLKLTLDTSYNHTLDIPVSMSISSAKRHDLPDSTITQLIGEIPNNMGKKFNNSKLGFNQDNSESWYRLSYPLFCKDGSIAIIKISRLCKGLCGMGELLLFTKNESGKWKKAILKSWWH